MKVYLESTGCRLNQSEIEMLAGQFRRAGCLVVQESDEADLCVVNTCAVTSEATRSSRALIRRLHRSNEDAQIVATGCFAHLEPDTIGALPGVAHVVNNLDKDRLVPLVLRSHEPSPMPEFDYEPLDREYVPGALGRTRAFVKVQDGCDNRCTFCVTTIARGKGRSRPLENIVLEIQTLVEHGYQEVVLTGVHLGSYGHDWSDRTGLITLIKSILERTSIPRVRVSSLEPWDLTPDFFDLWENSRLCRHLHLPLQSGCDSTLRRMARRTSQAAFGALVDTARRKIPDLAISTDVIVGFPGETDAEFENSRAFIDSMEFMKLHVFRFSPRPGTVAARLPGQVTEVVKKERSAQLLAQSNEDAARFNARFVGRTMDVLWEQVAGVSEAGFANSGLTDNYIRVDMDAHLPLTNTITSVYLAESTSRGLRADTTHRSLQEV